MLGRVCFVACFQWLGVSFFFAALDYDRKLPPGPTTTAYIVLSALAGMAMMAVSLFEALGKEKK